MKFRIFGLLPLAAFAVACCERSNASSALPQGQKSAEAGSARWPWRATAACVMSLAFGLFQTAQAQVTYYYTGNPFDPHYRGSTITSRALRSARNCRSRSVSLDLR
jgi:hypothetical protein